MLYFQASKLLPHMAPSKLALFCVPMPTNVNNPIPLRNNCSFQFLCLILFSDNMFFSHPIDDSGKVSLSMELLVPPTHHNYNNLPNTSACMVVSLNQLLISKVKDCLSLDFILCLCNVYESFPK